MIFRSISGFRTTGITAQGDLNYSRRLWHVLMALLKAKEFCIELKGGKYYQFFTK